MDIIIKELEKISEGKPKPRKSLIATYKGKPLKLRSGKSVWGQINHAKNAILCHFERLEYLYKYYPNGRLGINGEQNAFTTAGAEQRKEEFRRKLWELIEIVELK